MSSWICECCGRVYLKSQVVVHEHSNAGALAGWHPSQSLPEISSQQWSFNLQLVCLSYPSLILGFSFSSQDRTDGEHVTMLSTSGQQMQQWTVPEEPSVSSSSVIARLLFQFNNSKLLHDNHDNNNQYNQQCVPGWLQ